MSWQFSLRLLNPDDEALVRLGFEELSFQSRQLRYGFATRNTDSALGWVRVLGDSNHVAVGACAGPGQPVGVARYVRDSAVTEVAITVVDRWQGHGAGTSLLKALCDHAWMAGVTSFQATILVENKAALRLAERFGATRTGLGMGWMQCEIPARCPHHHGVGAACHYDRFP